MGIANAIKNAWDRCGRQPLVKTLSPSQITLPVATLEEPATHKGKGRASRALAAMWKPFSRKSTPNKFATASMASTSPTTTETYLIPDLGIVAEDGHWDLNEILRDYQLIELNDDIDFAEDNLSIHSAESTTPPPIAAQENILSIRLEVPLTEVANNLHDTSPIPLIDTPNTGQVAPPLALATTPRTSSLSSNSASEASHRSLYRDSPKKCNAILDPRDYHESCLNEKPLLFPIMEEFAELVKTIVITGSEKDSATDTDNSMELDDESVKDNGSDEILMPQDGTALAESAGAGDIDNLSELDNNQVPLENDDAPGSPVQKSSGTDEGDGEDKDKNRSGHPRHDWEAIHQIPDINFKRLLQFMAEDGELEGLTVDQCHIISRIDGGFNHIVIMAAIKGAYAEQFVVRVPAIGTEKHWQEGDAHNMRCEVALMKYLRTETKLPVPEIIAFEDDLDSWIGAPYILMRKLPGKPAYCKWFDDAKQRDYITANRVSPQTEAVRCNILRSLSTTMAELQHIELDKIGMPDFRNTLHRDEDPTVTHTYEWHERDNEDIETWDQTCKSGPFDSSLQYMTSTLDESWPSHPDPEFQDDENIQNAVLGAPEILDIIFAHPSIAFSKKDPRDVHEKETFVLRHPDLDLQNILVDDAGTVTGIIDWEGCLAVPRCVGYASVPDFLRRDWRKSYSATESPHMLWQFEHYRAIYSDAIRATGAPESKYTEKSAMYRAVVDVVNEGSATDLIDKLCKHVPGLRNADVEELEMLVGKGWPEAEEFLEREIGKLLGPGE